MQIAAMAIESPLSSGPPIHRERSSDVGAHRPAIQSDLSADRRLAVALLMQLTNQFIPGEAVLLADGERRLRRRR